jgi:hypothetical protein
MRQETGPAAETAAEAVCAGLANRKKNLAMTRDLYDANGKIKPVAGQRFK